MTFNVFNYSPRTRALLLLVIYALELMASLWLAYELRFDFDVDDASRSQRIFVLLWLVPLELVLLGVFYQLTPLLGYFSTPDLSRVFHALAISALIALLGWLGLGITYAPPRGVIVMNFIFGLVGITGARLLLRANREMMTTPSSSSRKKQALRVAILGAGDAGAVLAHELTLKPALGLTPVAFFDDNRRKWHSRVHDIPVIGPLEKLTELKDKLGIQEVIIAMPAAPARRIGELVRFLTEAELPFRTVPSLDQLALGQVSVTQLRKVQVQDLLGREGVELGTEDIRQMLKGRVVMVTGAGGSIGSELSRQIASYGPARLLLVDRSEPQLFQIEQELIGAGHRDRLKAVIADISDHVRMNQVLAEHKPALIYHAAAHKHVPMMEHQPGEAIKNNTLGTALLADLALAHCVERFVLISTDKAIRPTSVMGAAKRLAEMYVQSLSAAHPGRTQFMAVRFGNVLGSSGSVIPVFEKQIAAGGPVKVTHPDMTRYFMTIPEASMLVLQSAMQGTSGDIFVLDMGQPVKIVDLARQMIELSGLTPDEDIKIEFTGIRPGEKLYEEITHKGENHVPTQHAKIFRFISPPNPLPLMRETLQALRGQLHETDSPGLKRRLQAVVPEYTPYFDLPTEPEIKLPATFSFQEHPIHPVPKPA
jgi:FlaA1/EpsC-like NDP-sugar epimerase